MEHTDDVEVKVSDDLVGLRPEDLAARERRALLKNEDARHAHTEALLLGEEIARLPDHTEVPLHRLYEQARTRRVALLAFALVLEMGDALLLLLAFG